MTDIIICVVLIAILGCAAGYVYKAKKSGKKCIGCPEGCTCSKKGGCASQGDQQEK